MGTPGPILTDYTEILLLAADICSNTLALTLVRHVPSKQVNAKSGLNKHAHMNLQCQHDCGRRRDEVRKRLPVEGLSPQKYSA